MKTSNTQHPTSNNQWFPIGPLIGGWVLDVGCWMFPRVHGEGVEGGEGQSISSRNSASTPGSRWRLAVVETILRPSPPSKPLPSPREVAERGVEGGEGEIGPRRFEERRCSTSTMAVRAPGRSDLLTTTRSARSSITIF